MVEVREGLLYSETGMWLKDLGGNKVRIGMTDYAQTDLGDVVFVDLPKEGSDVNKGDEFGALESVKTVEVLYSPVSGKVAECNAALSGSPETINSSPYDDGWIATVMMNDASELKGLMDAKAYVEFSAKMK